MPWIGSCARYSPKALPVSSKRCWDFLWSRPNRWRANSNRSRELRADLVLRLTRAGKARPLILHLEVQSQGKRALILRMVRILTHLAAAYPHCDLMQAILWIGEGPCPYRPEPPLGESTIRLRVIDLNALSAETLLAQPDPRVAVLAILAALPPGWSDRRLLG